jgi:N-acetylglucosaminyldiphosphoundecaprenol N-acetyl-beta-D-mannosaminyltransferase
VSRNSIPSPPTVSIRGAELHKVTERQCIKHILGQLAEGRGGVIVTMNLDYLRRFVYEPLSAKRYQQATLITADGMPLIWASRLRGTPLPERVTGSNLIWSLTAAAAESGRSVYLLGGNPGTAQNAAAVLSKAYPNLRVAGASSGPPNLKEPSELSDLVSELAGKKPDIIYVALGSPKEERVIETMREKLPGAWWMGVGISFSFVAGEIARAPAWMQLAGLEWLHRLLQEPRRLAKRYLVHGLPFACSLLLEAAWSRVSASPGFRQSPSEITPPAEGEPASDSLRLLERVRY